MWGLPVEIRMVLGEGKEYAGKQPLSQSKRSNRFQREVSCKGWVPSKLRKDSVIPTRNRCKGKEV